MNECLMKSTAYVYETQSIRKQLVIYMKQVIECWRLGELQI